MSQIDPVAGPRATWTFLTSHARVLVHISRDPSARVRDIAARCLLTERAVHRLITDLEQAGYLTRTRTGRRNRYQVTVAGSLGYPADADRTVADLLVLFPVHAPGSSVPVGADPTADLAN